MPVAPSKRESKLLTKAKKFTEENGGNIPGRERLRRYLKCGTPMASRIRDLLKAEGYTPDKRVPDAPAAVAAPPAAVDFPSETKAPAGKPELTETNEVTNDKWVITLPKTRIHTLEQLLEACKVDTTVWDVERFICNKWEMGYKDGDGNPGTVPLFQVKAFLRKKYAQDIDGYVKDNALLRARLQKLQEDSARERRYTKRLALNHVGADDLLRDVKQFVDTLGDLSLPYVKPLPAEPLVVPAVRSGHDEDAVLLLSDTHYGDRIRREDTSGFPEFDITIAANRTGYVIRKAKQVLTLHRAMYPIKRLYVWIGGDIGNGILHDSPNSNELFTPAQVHFSYHMLKFALEDLLTLTVPDENGNSVIEEIVLLFTVGNHMRLDEKMPHKYQAQRTLDWLIYQFLMERFNGHPKVKIHSEMSPYIFENIRGHRYLFAHGMQVGYRNTPEAQGKSVNNFLQLVRGLFDSPEWRKKNGLMGETFSRVCIGDIHVPLSFPRFKSNGSLNGQNELGVNWTLEPIPAGQQLFGVADKHQETWSYFLECSQVQRAAEDFNSYGIFAAEYSKRIGR